jgi:hypothetical protein
MRRILACLFVLALASLACNVGGTGTPTAPTEHPGTTSLAPTQTPEPALPTNTPAPPPTNASCGKLSLYIAPALGTSYGCQTFPEEGNLDLPPFGINPQYSEITISGYPLADRFMSPHINIYPVQRYHELLTDLVDSRVAALQTLLGGGTPGKPALPVLPIQNAAQFFFAQYAVVPFQNGNGIRYITEYGQAYYPINNHDMWLSYQALTADGQYWISMILPMSHPSLPANGDNPPGGDWNAFYDTAEAYFAQTATALNAQAPDSFIPSIVQVDAMINSMVVTP